MRVNLVRHFDGNSASYSYATGFVVDAARGLILSNRHVVTAGPSSAPVLPLLLVHLPPPPPTAPTAPTASTASDLVLGSCLALMQWHTQALFTVTAIKAGLGDSVPHSLGVKPGPPHSKNAALTQWHTEAQLTVTVLVTVLVGRFSLT